MINSLCILHPVQNSKIERIQKCALSIILGNEYLSYKSALEITKIETLALRRKDQTLKFAKNAIKHKKLKNWFQINKKNSKYQKPKNYY